MVWVLEILLHADKYAGILAQDYGYLFYLIIFILIFTETGLVIFPILPADSLLFVLGAFAANGGINIYFIFAVVLLAAIMGDNAAYFIGKYFGNKISNSRFVKKKYMDDAHEFYDRYGAWTVAFARFVPFLRVFAPLVGGLTAMRYKRFLIFNIIGCVLWTSVFLLAGYFFGSMNFVQENFMIVLLIMFVASMLPLLLGLNKVFRAKLLSKKKSKKI